MIYKNRRQDLFDAAFELGIKVVNATDITDCHRIAIHLLHPDLDAFEDAINQAERDNFKTIVIHSNKTWPYKGGL